MNILMITSFYPPADGGIQTYSYEIGKNFVSLGNNICIAAITSNGLNSLFQMGSLKMYCNGKKSPFFKHVLDKYDVVMCTSWFPGALLGFFLSILRKSKFIICAHGNEILYPKKIPFMNGLMRWCFKQADIVFAVSNYTKNLLINETIQEEKIKVIFNGTNPDVFKPIKNFEHIIEKYQLNEKKIILSISRLVKRKNFGIVIQALPDILKKIPNVVYIIGGNGPMMNEWKNMARKMDVEKNVLFVGYIDKTELVKFYSMADVFVLPSLEIKKNNEVEGFGIALLEANACGTPVIAGNTGGMVDAVLDGKTGILINPLDKSELIEAIVNILNNPLLADSMASFGRRRVLEELSWKKITKKIVEEMREN